jgi:tetratricopeptide (TPR) repeat protein
MLEKDPINRPSSMAIAEALLCEAQIAAGIHTAWDDLELPAVDESWRRKLAERMPSPWGRQKKAIVAGALTLALAGASAAVYYGFLRAPEVVVKYVSLTQTEEAEGVAGWLEKAYAAARLANYTRPYESSALYFIERAEAEHARLRGTTSPSKGADNLRKIYASALAMVGNDLAKANLHHLAAMKFREALLFSPNDQSLIAKAELSDEERNRLRAKPAVAKEKAAVAPRPPPAPTPADEAKEAAASAYLLAAKQEKFSEARVALRSLSALDKDGLERAKLADAFRARADERWAKGDVAGARPFYQLTAELDSLDTEAARRAQAPVPATKDAQAAAAAAAAKADGLKKANAATGAEEIKAAPRDPKGSRVAVERGRSALGRLDLREAETNFNLALEADPTNAVAIGGLAEVAFERSRYAEALDYARRAVQQSPRSGRYLLLMGDAYFKLLRYADAKAAYQRAAQIASHQAEARGRLERLRTKLRE